MTRRVCLMAFSMFPVWCCAVLWVRGSDPDTGKKTITNSIGMKLVLIPAGEFLMGSPASEKDRSSDESQQRVQITKPFWLGMYEVTQGEYQKVMGKNPSWFSAKGSGAAKVEGQETDRLPVENVSWEDAVKFCERLSALPEEKTAGRVYRLPTEAEWEYACRAGSTTRYCFDESRESLDDFAWYDENSGNRTHPVGQKKPNAWGLYDMHGNVWEWCRDTYGDKLPGGADPVVETRPSESRVVRGGCWDYDFEGSCQSAFRFRDSPDGRNRFVGFRLAAVRSGR